LSLPILEQNPNGPASLAAAPLYAETAPAGGGIANRVEVPGTPGSPCPAASPPASSPPASVSASASSSSSASPSASASSASPSPGAAECYLPILPGSVDTKYNFPTSVTTAETLKNVNLTDDRVDSMFPPGQIGASTVTWQGVSGLSPSMSAANLASAARQNKDAFWAGLLYGITAALAVPFLQCLPDAWKDTKAIYQAPKAKDVQEHVEKIRLSPVLPRPEPPSGGRTRGGGSWW